MISIALCTYNGSRYLTAQLDSIAAQRRLPDEVVVSDDGSTDASVATVESFAESATFPIFIHRTLTRLGAAQNFARAIALCRGDVIFLCDQDDVWHPNKLALIEASLSDDPKVGLAFSNADVVDESLMSMGYDLWHHAGLKRRERAEIETGDALAVVLRHPFVTGATLAFRSTLSPLVLPIPDGWMHDAWIAAVCAATTGVRAMHDRLILYRQHSANVIGAKRMSMLTEASGAIALGRGDYYRREIGRFTNLVTRLESLPSGVVAPGAIAAVRAKVTHLERRRDLPKPRLLRIPGVTRELASGRYAKFAKDWKSVAADLLLP